jgi:hypothetical protein
MSKIKLIEYSPEWFIKWNKFVEDSNNGTIFHRLDFLEYHCEKFKETENHLIWLKGEEIFCVLPLAFFKTENQIVAKSPYGGSYGGIVCKKPLNYFESNEVVCSLLDYFRNFGVNEIIITLPTKNLEIIQTDTLFFSFIEHGFKIINSDISSVVVIDNEEDKNSMFTTRSRNMVRKARKANVLPKQNQSIDDFWQVMDLTFSKIGKPPTHTYNEWKYLCYTFPDIFWNDVAYLNNKPIAGIGHVKINKTTYSSFYLCSNPNYYETQALSLLITEALINAKDRGLKYFDFGTSSINMKANENIFRFKESFGSIGVFKHTIKYKCI